MRRIAPKGDAMNRLRLHTSRAVLLAIATLALPAAADVRVLPSRPPVVSGAAAGNSHIAAASEAGDDATAERVMRALSADPALEGAAITVLVDHGHVSLSGTTEDDGQAEYATEVAQDAAGPAAHVSSDNLQPALTAPTQ
jgi:BON domain-containing protein